MGKFGYKYRDAGVKEEVAQEPEVVEFKTVNELMAHLMNQGIGPRSAREIAEKQFASLVASLAENKKAEPEVAVTEEQPQQTIKEEEVTMTEVAQEKRPMKVWFKEAANKLTSNNKEILIGNLIIERLRAKTEEEKQDINNFINRLENEEGFYKAKVEPKVVQMKGWTVDATGKVADTLYLSGEYANKGAQGLTKAVGKTTQAIGKGIVKTGEFVEEHSSDVGKVAEAPFKAAGHAINIANGTKPFPKPENK